MTEGKNSNSESQEEQPKNKWKLDQQQYKRLIECSKKGPEAIEEWNEWRKENRSEQIWLEGADLKDANLQRADLGGAKLQGANLGGANLQEAKLGNTNLQGAELANANLQEAKLAYANLEGAKLVYDFLEVADLYHANLQEANLGVANLQGADLRYAKLQGVKLREANLERAELREANLQWTELQWAKLQGADFWFAKLQGANILYAKLQGAKFTGAVVNGSTCFLYCEIDKNTDFRHTALENVRIESGTKTCLKYNIRRMNWRDWYRGSSNHKNFDKKYYRPRRRACRVLWRLLVTLPVRLFWKMSDYGRSTGRVLLTFFILALFFAAVYSNLSCWWDIQAIGGPGEGFTVEPHLPLWHYSALIILRPIYFSVVTMTTLGFGDMFANAQSIWGHILLTLQVILGYVLLGALVTRLAVLFTSDGPAGSFTAMDEETKELLAKLKKDKGN